MLSLEEKKKIQTEIDEIKKKTKIISSIRLILALCIVVMVVCVFSLDDYLLYTIISLALIACLIILILLTNPIYHHLKTLNELKLIYEKHESRRNYAYQSFSPDGREFVDFNDYKELDLDLLGPKSLYQYLCVAKSNEGKKKLAIQLTNPVTKDDNFVKTVAAFATDNEYFKLEAAIANISSEAKDVVTEELLGVASEELKVQPLGIFLAILSYLLMFGLLIVLLINHLEPYYLFFFLPVNYFLTRHFAKNKVFNLNATKYANLLEAYLKLIDDVSKLKNNSKTFLSLKEKLLAEKQDMERYYKLFEILSYRKNIIFSILLNGLFFVDYFIILYFNKTKKKMNSIKESLDAISELELIASLAIIGVDNEDFAIPVGASEIMIREGYHPLIKSCVPNSLTLNGGIVLTGSNMSGKTTFMRMLGVNQILANAWGIVCAKEFRTPSLKVVTSLRANDMLQEGISTFYAEINRMKEIMNQSSKSKTLILVDEIFKGTNAKDRIYAAKQIMAKLNSFNSYFIITTHDFELCDTLNISNYHFDETYVDDKIKFDYKIKKGKCDKTNAIYLLKMSGVLE